MGIEIKYSPNKIKWNTKKIEDVLTLLIQKMFEKKECPKCGGHNLTVYINQIERNTIEGVYYCHDCNFDGSFTVNHEIFAQLEATEKELKKMFR